MQGVPMVVGCKPGTLKWIRLAFIAGLKSSRKLYLSRLQHQIKQLREQLQQALEDAYLLFS